MPQTDDRTRNESGQYNDRVDPETVLDVLDARDDLSRPVTAGDVAAALGIAQRTALNKLNELVAAGTLDSRTVGARARVFWRPIPSDTETRLKRLSAELGDPITVGERVFEAGDSHAIRKVRTQGRETREDDADALAALNLDAERRAAVAAMYDLLREQGTARKADFTRDVYPEHPAGFGTPDGWWNALGSGSTATGEKGSLGDLPGVRKPPSSGRPTWEYVG